MNPLGIALGFVILGFVGGVGSFLTIAGARNVYFGSQAHSGANAESVAAYSQQDLLAVIVNGIVLVAGVGLLLLSVLAVYNVIFG